MKRQILLGVLILLAVGGFATADVNVPDPCAIPAIVTIQDGIDAAVNGEVVFVADGVWKGLGNRDLDFGNGLPFGQTRAITVRSVNGPANCIIDCDGMGRAFIFENFEDNNSVVEGFTITNGSANYGGGIECDNSSPKIVNCIIIDNFASIYGGGVDLYMSSAVIINCKINNNSSNSDGGGINCDTDVGLPPTISFCEIIGNTTLYAGGGVNFYKSSAVVKNCLLKDNVAGDVGGAVYLWDSGPEISNCTIVDNTGSGNFGGIYRETITGLPTIKNSILWNNGDDLYNCLGLVSHSCVQDDDPGVGNRSGDPMFRDGPLGSYYLSQEDANQLATSPCVDAGIGLASDLVGPYSYTTRTDSIADACTVDMGYHYADSGSVVWYQLTTSVVDANGSIEPNHPSPGSPYVQFAEVALTADPCEGYEVQAWTGADNVPAAGEVNNVVTMDANKTVGVTFQAKPTYTLTFTAGANGEIIEPRRPGTYYKGTVVDLIVEPAPGYRVSHWTGADDLPGWNMNTNTVTMTSNKTVTVTFELDFSNIIHVPGDYPEIQLAIDAAVNGDTIVIADGIYPGIEFEINKNITITGQTPEDPNLVVIENVEGQFTASFTLRGAGGSGVCTISGLTIANGDNGWPDAPDGQDPNNDGWDGGDNTAGHVRIEGNHIVSNCIIRGHVLLGGNAGDGADGSTTETFEIEDPNDPNATISVPDVGAQYAGNGGWGGGAFGDGIYIDSGNPLIRNTIIEDCTVIPGHGGDGGDGSDEVVDDVNFPGSPGGDGGVPGQAAGGGVYCRPGTNPTFENCIIRNNVAVGSYGGDGGDAGTTFPDGQYIDHKGGFGGLFALDPNQPDPWTRSALGAGVYVGGSATFTNCRFIGNQTYGAHSGMGGLYSISWTEDPRRNNYIPGFGAAVYCRSSTNTTFTNCTFEDNETVYGGYPGPHLPPDVNVYTINGPTGFGGAISIGSSAGGTAHSVIIDCNFAENTSDFGGAFYGVNSDLRFEDCNFISNLGATGGAMATAGESIAEISGSIFRGNVATYAPGPNQVAGTGGGLFCMETELLASDCIITGNLAYNSGGGVYLGGDLETGSPVLNNCLITDNTAGRTGGGVTCDWFVSPVISNCTIADNTTEMEIGPSYGGGLFCTMSSFPRVIDSIIWGNASINGGEIAVTNGDLGFPLPSRLNITYSDIGPRYAYLGFNSDAPFAGGSGQGGGTILVDGQSIYDQFDAGQDRVKIIVSLFEPVEMREETDWELPDSVGALRAEIASRQSTVLSSLTSAEFTLRHLYENQAGFSGEVTAGGLNKLLSNPSVAYIEPVRYVQPALAQAIPLANALEARQVYDGTGIAVAIVDTGVDYTHPRLGGGVFPNEKVIGGYDTGNDDNDPIPGGIFTNTAHGTCCAGIAAGDLGTVGDYIGGVAYNAKIYALKATSDDDPLQGFWDDDTLAAWDWCVTHRNDDPDNPIKVMSNSWYWVGLPFNDPAIADAFSPAHTVAADTAVTVGITILAASGNDGFAGDGISWPSAMSNVISVGAVYDTTDAVTGYSNTADNLDILAPADPVYTTDIVGLGGYDPGDYYPYFNGTSSACPFAAGAVASLKSAALAETESYLTPAQLRNLLVVSGDPVTDTKVAITKPRVNLGVAINYLISGPIYVEEGSTLDGLDPAPIDPNNPWVPGTHNIVEDPNFLVGYYLSQFAAGQIKQSNCVDGGHTLASVLGMDAYTTRTDGFPDTYDPNHPDPNSIKVDMGYHYPLIGLPQYHLTFTAFDTNGLDPCDQPVIIEPIIDPCDGWYNPFRVVELRVSSPPTDCQVLWNGTDNDDITGPNNLVTMYANRVVTVTFLRNTYNLTVEVIGTGGTVFPLGTHTYPRGTVVTLTADPCEDYRVKAWSGTDDDFSTATTNSVVMNSDRTVTVEFEQPQTLIVAVGGGEEGDYTSVQDALHDAEDGDTIVVHPGTYYGGYLGETIVVNKSVTIRSLNPDDPCYVAATIIDGYNQSQFNEGYNNLGIAFMSDAVLDGFTIQNCGGYWGTGFDGTRTNPVHPDGWEGGMGSGAAIRFFSGVSVTIKNCIIRDNIVIGGDGGDGVGANTTQNAGRGGWGGWAYGGAVYCLPGSNVTFIKCQIIDNEARGGNGGDGGNDVLVGGMENYGGNWSRAEAFNIDPFSLDITFVQGDLWEVWGVYVGDYRWYSAYGGGVFIDSGSEISFIDCTISGNRTYGGVSGQGGENIVGRPIEPLIPYELPSFGGGVYCAAGSTVAFTDCTITDNIASEPNLDNHHLDPYLGYGGGVCAEDTATLEFTDCIFSENEASVGGGIHFANSNASIIDSNFTNNSAYQGGGVFGEHGLATIMGCKIINNIAVVDELIEPNDPNVTVLCSGGGLHLWIMDVDIIDCEISTNQASVSGGGVYFGSDIHASGENASSLINCLLTNNTAGRDGGGVSNNLSSQLMIANCTIAINRVSGIDFPTKYGGGLYCFDESNTDIIDSILWGNTGGFGSQIAIEEGPAGPATVNVTTSDVQGAQSAAYVGNGCTLNWDPNNLHTDPLFVIGPLGDYYLSQTEVDDPCQTVDSPCVDAGSDLASRLGMNRYTTRTDEVFDKGIVDMGYHHLFTSRAEPCRFCDLFFDHIINFADFAILFSHWLEEGCSDANDWCQGADVTFDTYVDFEDLDFFSKCWLVEDVTAPLPNPSEWAIRPYSSSLTSISMVAKTAVDTWGGDVGYYFECVYGDCNDSGWQSDPCYTDDAKGFGLDPNTEYGYRVKAKDSRCGDISDLNCTFDPNDPNDPNAPNKTDWSDIRYAITSGEEKPPDTDPPSPAPVISSYTATSSSITLSATTASDESGVEYYFEDVNAPAVNSGWQDSPIWEDTNLAPSTTYTYWVKARDTSPWHNETEWSPLFDATTLAEGEEPPELQAPVIVGASQVEVGAYWHHVITAQATAVDPLYFRFVCLNASTFNSAWVPRDGNAVDTFDHPVLPEMPDATITRGSDVITYDIALGLSWNLWQWQVCGSNEEDYDPALCSDPCVPSLPF